MEIVGLVAGVVSVIVACVAIWQAMYFYTQGKATEGRVEVALAGMKAQVDTLQAVNAKITERLTRFVTAPRNDAAQTAELFAVTLRTLPEIALKFQPPSQATNETALRHEITLAYVGLWYYAATANVWASFCLPRPEEFDPERHAYIKHIVDQSATDFRHLDSLVLQLDQQVVQNERFEFAHLYAEVTQQLRGLVGDTSEQFARMSKQT